MDDGYSLSGVIIFLCFIILDAVFYGFGAAIQNVNIGQLEKAREEKDPRAGKLLHIMESPSRFIHTNQITTNLIGVATGAFVLGGLSSGVDTFFFAGQADRAGWLSQASLAVVTILLLLALISFGIVVPKKCAARNPERWAYATLPVVSFVSVPLYPFTWAVMGLSWVVLKMLGVEFDGDKSDVTEEEIMLMVNEGHEKGVLEASEAEMITNIVELGDKDAGDVMTHRTNVVAIDCSLTLREAVTFILKEANNSRFPVYEKEIDDIVGILHMRDALVYAADRRLEETKLLDVPGLLREAHFIPETRNLGTLFQEMQSQKIHMEIVVDEYGQMAGIVTMEDILEEIVGNILDEYDEDEEFISRREDGSYIIDGMTPLEDMAKALDFEFDEEDYDTYDTVNGFLISKLDRIPQQGEELEIDYRGYRLKVLSVENKMIHTVLAAKLTVETEELNNENQMAEKAEEGAAG